MSPARLRKMALYLEYIALTMRRDADEMEQKGTKNGRALSPACTEVPAPVGVVTPVASEEVPALEPQS